MRFCMRVLRNQGLCAHQTTYCQLFPVKHVMPGSGPRTVCLTCALKLDRQ